jgi:hypothetical protein
MVTTQGEVKVIKPMRPREVVRMARDNGLDVISGRGRHGLHIVDNETGESRPLPDHGRSKTLSPGVTRGLVRFIEEVAKRRKPLAS